MSADESVSERLDLLAEAVHTLNDTVPYEQLSRKLAQKLRVALGAEAVLLWLVAEDGEHLAFELAHGKRDRALRGTKLGNGHGVAGAVAKRGKPLLVRDARGSKRYALGVERKLGLRPKSILAVPLVHRGEVIGVLEAVNRRDEKPFSRKEVALAAMFAETVANAAAHVRLRDKLKRLELEYSTFKKVSRSMGRSLSPDEVLQRILRNLKRLVTYDAAAIFVLDRERGEIVSVLHHGYPRGADEKINVKRREGLVGLAMSQRQGIIAGDVRKNPTYVEARGRTRSEMVAPMVTQDRVMGVFNLESDNLNAYSPADLRLVEAFAGQAAVSIERAHLYEDQHEKMEIQEELRLARTVQDFFLPQKSVTLGRYRISGVNFPSLEVSGDYFDYFPVRGGLHAFAIADVAGKGVPASIIMSSFRATMHTVAPYLTSARQIAIRANQILLETVRPQDFVTAFVGVIDPATGLVTYCNAGHNPPVLMSPDGGYRLLETGGPILGILENLPLTEGRFRLRDETLVCYTDGATEARNAEDEEYGEARLVASMKEHLGLTPYRMGRAMFKGVREFSGGGRQGDDVTYLILKHKK